MKLFRFTLTAFVVLFSFVAFGQAADRGVLNFGLYAEPATVDPTVTSDVVARWIGANTYDTLVRYQTMTDEDGVRRGTASYGPWLAESWEASADGRTYTFSLREGVKFHNGEELTSDDVVYSLQRQVIMALGPAQLLIDCVAPEDITATGRYEVTVGLQAACPYFLDLMAQPQVGSIFNKEYVEAHGGVEPGVPNRHLGANTMGTGAFQFANHEPGVRYELVAFDDYWAGTPELEKVTFHVISDLANQYLLLQQGRLDVVYNPPMDILEQAMTRSDVHVVDAQTLGLQTLYMPNHNPPFDDWRVRQAIQYAIDLDEINQAVTLGLANPPRSAFPDALPGFTPELWTFGRDLDKARELLAEAGYPDGFSTTISYNTGNNQRELSAIVLQSQLAEVGIDVEVQSIAWPTYVEMYQAGTMPMYIIINTATPVTAQFLRNSFMSENHGVRGNYAFYTNEDVDRMIEEYAVTVDAEVQQQLAHDIQAQLLHDAPSVLLYNAFTSYLVRPEVQNWITYPSGDWFFFGVSKE